MEPDNITNNPHCRQQRIEHHVKAILEEIEPLTYDRQGLVETPKRVAKAFAEYFSGYGRDGQELLGKTFEDDVLSTYRGAVIVGPISFYSHCEHHLAVFHGTAYVGYIPGDPSWEVTATDGTKSSPALQLTRKPDVGSFIGLGPGNSDAKDSAAREVADVTVIPGKVVGLSKLAKLIELYARRLQVQERLTQQIADDLEKYLQPKGVMVVMNAIHTCMCARGARALGCNTTTSSVTGVFESKPEARAEFLHLMQWHNGA